MILIGKKTTRVAKKKEKKKTIHQKTIKKCD